MSRLIFSRLVVSLLFLVSIATDAQTPTPALSAGAAETAKPFDPAVATRAWLESVPREKREKSDAYFEGGYWLILWNFLLAAAISIFLLTSRISAGLRDFAERICRGSRWLPQGSWQLPLQVVLYAILSGTSIWVRHANFCAVVLGTINWAGPHTDYRHNTADCSLRRFPACVAHMVDLGNRRGGHFLIRARLYRACLYRAAFQYL